MSRARGILDVIKREIRVLTGHEPRIRTDLRVPMKVHGSTYGRFTVWPGGLGPGSIVYSLGVGEDISFDLSIIEEYGVTVHAFDPTPRTINWIARQRLPPSFHFHPWAVSDRDGILELYPPADPAHVSHSVISDAENGADPVRVDARRLSSIAQELGHTRIALLKMDIEGAEYSVLADLLKGGPYVEQIAVEFHHWFRRIPGESTLAVLAALRVAGYGVFAISPRGHEVCLLRPPEPEGNVLR